MEIKLRGRAEGGIWLVISGHRPGAGLNQYAAPSTRRGPSSAPRRSVWRPSSRITFFLMRFVIGKRIRILKNNGKLDCAYVYFLVYVSLFHGIR